MNEKEKHTLLKIEFENGYYITSHKDLNGEGIMKTKSFEHIASYVNIILERHDNIKSWDHLRVEGWFE